MAKENFTLMMTSVIIPTYQGCDRVLLTLNALENQSVNNFEVIVVIDGSTDNTKVNLEKHLFNFKSFKVIDQKNKGRAGARNTGVKHAEGQLLIFYDDDTIPDKASVEKHCKFHFENSNSLLVGNTPQYLHENVNDFELYRASLSENWVAKYPMSPIKLKGDNLFLVAANLSINKADFNALTGFDESLSDAEDLDLGIRAFQANFNIYYDKSNIALHKESVDLPSYVTRLRHYAIANKILLGKHPVFLKSKNIKVTPIKRLIYRLFTAQILLKCINQNALRFVPIKIRYRLYDAIIFSLSKLFLEKKI